ncbi:decaprenyl-phosphate phosphoribosyltransferase [Aquella oligotrophica]|uniref:Decaprenyl-phosphate phosphoribosyltransferase n=1 Tax=Aquella oligotrophica TaxID=2067065 RepID=A0A2I7N567_9NEIS|nr:decaprenyl-phosphate phosphoribosyltransferase [Aquella oligotrophica]AUR51609.1 decaprenyl-phosphate phosphoribosyltransferase [Aquella oligotrophica]
MKQYLKLFRPYQWVKNMFCFAGVAFGFHFTDGYLLKAILGFIVFCAAASSVYILNDILDVEADRSHPRKRNRPLASGVISIKTARKIYLVLAIFTLLGSLLISKLALLIVASYLILNVYYSKIGKHIVILDVFIISFGFLLRVFMGTLGIGIPLSEWLILCVIMLTLFLGFAKRRSELLQCEVDNISLNLRRSVLEHYEPKMLDIFLAITATSSVISYALFVVIGKGQQYLIYTILFVIYGIFRYIYLLYSHDKGQDTANDLLDDKHLIITVVLWITTYITIFLMAKL